MGKLGATGKKWLLTLHLLFSGLMLGEAFVFLILSITAANTSDAGVLLGCYTSMHVLSKTAVRYSVIFVMITGILLSVRTHWGLFKFNWLIAKEILTLLSVALGPIGMYVWTLKAVKLTSAEGTGVFQDPSFIVNRGELWTGIILQILSLSAILVLSVFKPWGPRKKRHNPE
ncbi:hypothetical protein SD70_22380 [Gordoniibacillus kamchatkensis]|uniref:DUF2269 domain-containing protein n=1 Tax=Gordoniibacillus kamchatkensis TaxID=1590651 RepID=A0ABR5ADF4_9BACL|nr:DUF2269 family protein [Paenibacillus sp. VKM B-2647]KIL39076.1 hypothetical protein SD70_22380 [Paenibacillus sp. VKM B-2647]